MPAVEKKLADVAGAVEARLPELVRAIVARIGDEVEAFRDLDTAQLETVLAEGTRQALVTELAHLGRAGALPESCPADTAEGARLAANARVPLTALLQTQRIGHAVVWEAYIDAAERLADERATRRALQDAGSRFFFAYADLLARFTAEEYERESARLSAGRGNRSLAAVMDVLSGSAGDGAEIGYPLDIEHVGALAQGPDAEAALRELARALDRRLLVVEGGGGVLWAWLGDRAAMGSEAERVLSRFEPRDCTVALGGPASGADGFRSTHWQAHEAHRVALRRPAPLTRYRDVALDALALRDERGAPRFVELELGALGSGDRARMLRETLRAYFACSQNAAATAAALNVHEQTVSQRIRTVEKLIGAPVNARRAELDTALRLEELLGCGPSAIPAR